MAEDEVLVNPAPIGAPVPDGSSPPAEGISGSLSLLSFLSGTSEVISELEAFQSVPATPAPAAGVGSRVGTGSPAPMAPLSHGRGSPTKRHQTPLTAGLISAQASLSKLSDGSEPDSFHSMPATPRTSKKPSRAQSRQDVLAGPELFTSAPPTPAPSLRASKSPSEGDLFHSFKQQGKRPTARCPPLLGLGLLALPLSVALSGGYAVCLHLSLRARISALEQRHGTLYPSHESAWFAPFAGAAGVDGGKRVVTSSAFPYPLEGFEEQQVLPHEPFRRSVLEVDYHLTRLADAAVAEARAGGETTSEPGAGAEARRTKTLNFFSWLHSRFRPTLLAHHAAEDALFFPWVRARHSVPDSIEADHALLSELLAEMAAMAPAEADSTQQVDAALAAVSEAWAAFRAVLFTHFTEEELLALAVKDAHTPDEAAAMSARLRERRLAAGGLRRLELPMVAEAMIEWAGRERYDEWRRAELPRHVRLALDYLWMPAHVVWHDGFLQSLRSERPERLDEATGRFCDSAAPSAAWAAEE